MTMKLLLRENVEHLGKAGDLITVANGYGRNYLLPRKLAVEVTAANIKAIEDEKKLKHAKELERVKDLQVMAERIAAVDITIKERAAEGDSLYGSVQAKNIVQALANEGIKIAEEMVKMSEPIKNLGMHKVEIKLHPEVTTEVKLWVVAVKDNEPIK